MADTGSPWNLPYPLPTDLVRDGADAIKDLAEQVALGLDAAGNPGIGSNVVSTTKNDPFTTTSSTLVDVTGLTVTITPSSATSKVLIIADITIASSEGTFFAGWLVTDNSDNPIVAVASGNQYDGANDFTAANGLFRQTKHYLASPGVATPVTYKVRAVMLSAGGRTVFINRSPNNVQFAVSTITAIEVAA